MARGTGCTDEAQARPRAAAEPVYRPPRAHALKVPTRERTDVAELDGLVETFLAENPEIPDEWLDMRNEERAERGQELRPHKRLSEMRFDPAAGVEQPSRQQCGHVADLFDTWLKARGAFHRSFGAVGFERSTDGGPDPSARPQREDAPPERDGYHFIFYAASDTDAEQVGRAGLGRDGQSQLVLATTPEAAAVAGKTVLWLVVDDAWTHAQALRRRGDDRFALGAWPDAVAPERVPAEALHAVRVFDPTVEPATAERIEIVNETSPRHPTNRVAATMDPNPFDLVMTGELDIEEGLDWSELYGYGDGKYRKRKDKTHQTTVLLHRGQLWSVDFSAGQYGYDALPMVQGFDLGSNAWTRDF